MKKFILIAVVGLTVALSSCGKGCATCVGGDWDGAEICSDDGYGRISTKAFKQDCKAAGGSIN